MNLINWFLFLILLESLLSTLISGMALLPLLDVITMSTVSFLVQLDFGIYWVQNVFNDFRYKKSLSVKLMVTFYI